MTALDITDCTVPRALTVGLVLAAFLLAPTTAAAVCGDGILDKGEACDDLNTTPGDGCDGSCQVEDGWVCQDAGFYLDFNEQVAYEGYADAAWVLSKDGLTLDQSLNADADVYMSTLPATGVSITFELSVLSGSDDDLIGWVVAYEAKDHASKTANWILFDWKQADQEASGYMCSTGLAMSRVQGPIGDWTEIWGHVKSVTEVTRALTLGSTGWVDYQTYTIQMDYTTTQIDVWVDGKLEFSESGSFPAGNFGFYNYSQEAIVYSLVSPLNQSVCGQLDTDGDGTVDSEDCDPDDPDVNPGADEDCGDGVDNDCDGDVDGADQDCGGDDDTGDDDTGDDDAGDDDTGDDDDGADDDTASDDDDDTGDGGGGGSGSQNCECESSIQGGVTQVPAAGLILLSLVLAGRRRRTLR